MNGIDLDSLHKYLDRFVGKSKIRSVVVEYQDFAPFWKIINIIDSDGKKLIYNLKNLQNAAAPIVVQKLCAAY